MRGIVYDGGPGALWVFVVLTVILGGAAAWASGRAIAQTWRPLLHVPPYMLILAAAVRFLHYALFGESLLSLHYYLVAVVVTLAGAGFGYFSMRAQQMSTQYSWAFDKTGPWGWKEKTGPAAAVEP